MVNPYNYKYSHLVEETVDVAGLSCQTEKGKHKLNACTAGMPDLVHKVRQND